MLSRRFYIATRAEYQNLRRTKGKSLRSSRKRKGEVFRVEEDDDDEAVSLSRVAQDLEVVSGIHMSMYKYMQ